MNSKDIVRQNGEVGNTPGRYMGNSEEYPSFPSLYRDMTNWMPDWDNLLSGSFGPQTGWANKPGTSLPRLADATRFYPAIDIRESDNGYTVVAELPGIDPKEVEITVQEGTLLLKGEKKFEQESKGEGYHRMERSYGSFRRGITLPKGVDVEHIDATFNNGLLTLNVPKLPESKPQARKIEIKSSARQAEQTRLEEPNSTGTGKNK